ncbi:MAG: hypothetical protein HZA90_20660 [Verrucomicrobia bacterium]|nr:hypothetical protein [Verrucomicrobiota bacterium]
METEPPHVGCYSLAGSSFFAALAASVLVLLAAASALGQVAGTGGTLKGFRIPAEYYPATFPGQTNQVLKTSVSGMKARLLTNGLWEVEGLRIESFRQDGRRDLEIHAANCLWDDLLNAAFSPAHLQVTSGGFYSVEGDGFFWRKTDGLLVVSNHVVSILNRDLLAAPSADLLTATNPPPAATPPSTGQVVRITSDRCIFNSQSNLLTQMGSVVAEDQQMKLSCEALEVRFTPAKRLKEVRAERNVTLLNKSDQSRANSGVGLYLITPQGESITLTEDAVWRDREDRQEVRADVFTYNLKDKSIRGEGHASMRLPRGSFTQPSLMFGARPALTNPPPVLANDTNQIHITAAVLTMLLRTTNRPHLSAVAETNVVVLSPADATRATGDKAIFDEAAGRMELQGRAQWEAEGRLVKADTLSMDRTNRVFSGRGNVFFKLPLLAAGQTNLFKASTNRLASANLFLEVLADEMAYRTNQLVFQGGVRARLLDGAIVLGQLTCETLTARFTDRIDSLLAEKRVMAEQYPPLAKQGRAVTNLLSCEVLSMKMSESGQVIALVAAENVQAAQVQVRTNSPKPVITELTCGVLTAVLLPRAGVVDKLHAEQNVEVQQNDKVARGQDAIYIAQTERLELTGHPSAQFTDGKITDADVLVWDRSTSILKARGPYRIEWTKPKAGTNRFELFPKKPASVPTPVTQR